MTNARTAMQDLLEIMAKLRDPKTGCAWDIQQNFETIAAYTIEEAYEVSDAIASKNRMKIKDELGDLLLQIVFHARIAEEENSFNFHDVAIAIADKMIRRHPHIFAKEQSNQDIPPDIPIEKKWERIKAEERKKQQIGDEAISLLDDISPQFPAMIYALKLQKRAASAGFDWSDIDAVIDKLYEEIDELKEALAAKNLQNNTDNPYQHIAEEIGDILFTTANLARKLDIDPESALLATNRKFEQRFRYIEHKLNDGGVDIETAGQAKLDKLWEEAKIKSLS